MYLYRHITRDGQLKFVKGVSITYFTQIIIIFVSLITSILVARYLGPSGRGVFAVLSVLTALGIQMGNLGFPAATVYFLGKSEEKRQNIFHISLVVGLVGGSIISFFIFLMCLIFPDFLIKNVSFNLLVITIISFPFLLGTSLFSNFLLGIKKYIPYNLFSIISKFVSLLKVIIILVFLGLGLMEFVIGTTIAALIVFIFYLIYIYRLDRYALPRNIDKSLFNEMWKYGRKSYLASTLGFLIIRSDILMVNYFLGSVSTGIYSISVTLIDFVYLLPGVIGTILFTKVSSGAEYKFTQKVFRSTLLIMIGIGIFAAILAGPLINLMYGQEFQDSISPFIILLPGIIFLGVDTILMQDLAGRGLPRIVYISPFIALVFNVILNMLLIPCLDVNGAAISSTISYFLMLVLMLRHCTKLTESSISNYILIREEDVRQILKIMRDTIK